MGDSQGPLAALDDIKLVLVEPRGIGFDNDGVLQVVIIVQDQARADFAIFHRLVLDTHGEALGFLVVEVGHLEVERDSVIERTRAAPNQILSPLAGSPPPSADG